MAGIHLHPHPLKEWAKEMAPSIHSDHSPSHPGRSYQVTPQGYSRQSIAQLLAPSHVGPLTISFPSLNSGSPATYAPRNAPAGRPGEVTMDKLGQDVHNVLRALASWPGQKQSPLHPNPAPPKPSLHHSSILWKPQTENSFLAKIYCSPRSVCPTMTTELQPRFLNGEKQVNPEPSGLQPARRSEHVSEVQTYKDPR